VLTDFDGLWDYSQPGKTEQQFRALLPEAEASGDVSYLAQLLTQIGRTQGLQGDFEAANRMLNRADALLSDDLPIPRIRALLERGRVLNSSGNPEGSIAYFLDAWELARKHGEDFYAVDAAHMLGVVESPAEQLTWSIRALELAESSQEARARTWLGPLFNNLGWSYHDLGRYDEALDTFERSLAWRQEQKQPRETRIAAWTVARCLRSLGRLEEALDLQRENLHAANESGDAGGVIEEEIGECLLALGRSDEARQHFQRAYQEVSKDRWLVEHEAPRLKRLEELARR
jgi:tetratricopeptide (TPR) repeat protein